ncbi:MAG: transposase [Clostridia bacterium]|nr:transposase [Clostridia bacterium]
MANETSEQLNTAVEDPDYKALYFAQMEQDKLKDTVIAGLKDTVEEQHATITQQNSLLRQKNKKLAEYEASDVKSGNRDKIKQQAKMLDLEDKVALLQAAAKKGSKPEDVSRMAELENVVAGYKQMEINYLELQKSYDAMQEQHKLALRNQQTMMFASNKVMKENASLRQLVNGDVLKVFDRQQAQIDDLIAQLKTKDEALETCYSKISSMQKQIDNLTQEVSHWKAIHDHGSGLTNQPPSTDTPAHKAERTAERKSRTNEFNLREPTDRKPGGQENHTGAFLKALPDEVYDEVMEVVADPVKGEAKCPYCGCNEFEVTDDAQTQTEIGVRFVTYLKRTTIHACKCCRCRQIINREDIQKFKEAPCVYGLDIKAGADYLNNFCNVPIDKVAAFFEGISKGVITLSNGWICKNNERLAELAKPFYSDLSDEMIKQMILQWDDTVIPINGFRANLRVYSNKTLALYAAHLHKGLASIVEDGILNHISPSAIVEHDDCITNYSKALHFIHACCTVHFMRHLLKLSSDTKHKVWEEMKDLIMKALEERKVLIGKDETAFDQKYIDAFKAKFMELVAKAEMENERDAKLHPKESFFKEERKYLKKIHKQYDRFFLWMTNFSIPPDNNLCERALRPVKSKTKQSGQFKSLDGAKAYAIIKSYMDTCALNGIARYEAIRRVAEGNPYTLAEVLAHRAV